MRNPEFSTIAFQTCLENVGTYCSRVKDIIYLLAHVNPSPVYPVLQMHILVPPITLIHCSLTEHPPLLVEHSLMSRDEICILSRLHIKCSENGCLNFWYTKFLILHCI